MFTKNSFLFFSPERFVIPMLESWCKLKSKTGFIFLMKREDIMTWQLKQKCILCKQRKTSTPCGLRQTTSSYCCLPPPPIPPANPESLQLHHLGGLCGRQKCIIRSSFKDGLAVQLWEIQSADSLQLSAPSESASAAQHNLSQNDALLGASHICWLSEVGGV